MIRKRKRIRTGWNKERDLGRDQEGSMKRIRDQVEEYNRKGSEKGGGLIQSPIKLIWEF